MMIRSYSVSETDAVVRPSLRAWEPAFASIEWAMDPEVYRAFDPDFWRASQPAAVEVPLAEQDVWVVEWNGAPVGIVLLHYQVLVGRRNL